MTETQRLLKRMIVSAINAREVENARVSRLLHDEVGQVLSAVGLQMDVLKLDFKAQVPEIIERIHEIQKMLEHAVEQVRALSYDLNPSVVERAGFHRALDRLAGRFRSQFPGTLRILCDPNVRLPLEIANVWYKIAELALENSVQHAQAGRIEVTVRATKRSAVLEVSDDGRGFSPEDANVQTPGLGLLMIEHYAAQVPIDVSLRSQPGKGTTVRAAYPARKKQES
jgi:signal transduction histidine kinase